MVPRLIFIVPYRDREQQLLFFRRHMAYLLEDCPTYEIFIVHQCDNRDFNRGAMKNIGFLAVRDKYPHEYRDMTLVFNDVDTMPYTKNFLSYETRPGTVKHFYGWTNTLGGIFSITGQDFERTCGFPNLWAWGYEDNMIQQRVLDVGLAIDRSQFYPMADKNIMQFSDGLIRSVNRTEFDRFLNNTSDGVDSLTHVQYRFEHDMVNVYAFDCEVENRPEHNVEHDLSTGSMPFPIPTTIKKKKSMKLFLTAHR